MKNLKKVLALVVVFAMMMSTVAFASYPDVDTTADYAGAVELRSALNVLKGDDQGNFNPGFKIALHIKDLNNVLEAGHSVGAPLPLTNTVMEMMQWMRATGKDMLDHSAIVQYYEYLSGTDVRG